MADSVIITHPENAVLLRQMLAEGFGDRFSGIPVYESRLLPVRKTREVWHPPLDERYVAFGPEDEHWMRPLGLGAIEKIDEGPLFVEMMTPLRVPDIRAEITNPIPRDPCIGSDHIWPQRVLYTGVY